MTVRTLTSRKPRVAQVAKGIIALPPVSALVRLLNRSHITRNLILRATHYRSVFPSFADARKALEGRRKIGYDHPEAATLYVRYAERVVSSDYPVLFWLQRILAGNSFLFDFGGNIGLQCYAYSRYLQLGEGFRWLVCDVPSITAAGEEFATRKGASPLKFTNRFADCDGADVLLISGTLQYLDTPLPVLMAPVSRKPRHLLINRIPLSGSADCVTLQDIGPVVCPYLIRNRKTFIESVESLGYVLEDEWEVPHLSLYIPFFPELSVTAYSGLYFVSKPS